MELEYGIDGATSFALWVVFAIACFFTLACDPYVERNAFVHWPSLKLSIGVAALTTVWTLGFKLDPFRHSVRLAIAFYLLERVTQTCLYWVLQDRIEWTASWFTRLRRLTGVID